MAKKKKQRPSRPEKPACLEGRWHFDPDVPTYDLFEHRNLDKAGDLGELVQDVIGDLEHGDFLMWEAVVSDELGLTLTRNQAKALSELLDFSEGEGEDRILYINEIPRPSEPWYEIVRKIAPHLLVKPYKTDDIHEDVTYEGWTNLASALEDHGEGLSLPAGVDRPVDVVPIELQHRLRLQTDLTLFGGLGQSHALTLQDEEELVRIEEFIARLREHRETVEYLDLTLEKVMTVLILPPQDEPIFVEMMQKELGLDSMQDKIAEHL
jgi:hypothetical protein